MLRWTLAVVLVVVAVAAVVSGLAQVCAEQAVAGDVREVCRPPRAGDALTLAVALLLAFLVLPDAAEVSLPGFVQIKRRLDDQDERLADLDAHLTAVAAQMASAQAVGGGAVVNVVSGVETGRFAVESVERVEVDAVLSAARADSIGAVSDALDRARYVAAELLVAHLDDIGSGALADCNIRLYLPADDGGTLRPVLDQEGARRYADSWPSGSGVVGRAWRDGEIVVARGAEVTAGLAELGPERLARYSQLAVVVALPVFNASRRPVAVLSASSRDPASDLDSPDSISELIAATEVVGRVLVDLLGWAVDAEIPGARTPPWQVETVTPPASGGRQLHEA